MKLNQDFRTLLEYQLRKNKDILLKNNIELANNSIDNYYRIIFENIIPLTENFFIDKEFIIDQIEKTLENPSVPILQLKQKTDIRFNFEVNELLFPFAQKKQYPEWFDWRSEKYLSYKSNNNNLHYDCETEFWSEKENETEYNTISSFESFLDIEVPKQIFENYYSKLDSYLINKEGWLSYINNLIQVIFPSFIFNPELSTEKTYRFLKLVDNSFYLGFEYDKQFLITSFNNGIINLPEYLNIIVIPKTSLKIPSPNKYQYSISENIISLGILGNPFFYHPAYPLDIYETFINMYRRNHPMNTNLTYMWKHSKTANGNVVFTQPEDYGELLKKHAFFYMKLLEYSSKGYIEYIEKSIREISSDE